MPFRYPDWTRVREVSREGRKRRVARRREAKAGEREKRKEEEASKGSIESTVSSTKEKERVRLYTTKGVET